MDVETVQSRSDALAHLTPLQRQVLQVAASDCPMKRKSVAARLHYLIQAIFDTTPNWMVPRSPIQSLKRCGCSSVSTADRTRC